MNVQTCPESTAGVDRSGRKADRQNGTTDDSRINDEVGNRSEAVDGMQIGRIVAKHTNTSDTTRTITTEMNRGTRPETATIEAVAADAVERERTAVDRVEMEKVSADAEVNETAIVGKGGDEADEPETTGASTSKP